MTPEKTARPAEIVLASRSPRRRELLARIAPDFQVFPVDVDEASVDERDPARFAVAAAVLKAMAAAESFPEAVVIGADTVVAIGGRMLGKPTDRASAREMLETLSGRRHRVITGVAFFRRSEDRLLTGWDLTWVTFRELTGEMIDAYLDENDYLDKAGAYAVQDIGDAFVKRLKGDYDNVVGFPVKKVAAMLARFTAPPVDVTIEDLDFPGSRGVGEAGGRKIFVPGAVVGDTVRVQVVRERGETAEAEILRIVRPSPHRTAPGCPHFGVCGGCLFQDTAYEKQVTLKRRFLERVLGEAGLLAGGSRPEVREVVPSPRTYGYRNKMEFGFGEEYGELVLGLRERSRAVRQSRSHTIALSVCPIFGPAVESIFPLVLEFAREKGLAAYDAWTDRGDLRHLVLREGKNTGELMILLITRAELDVDLTPLASSLAARLPGLRSFFHVASPRTCDIVSFEEMRLVLGGPSIAERLAGLTFRIYPQTFFQTNTAAAEGLYGTIAGLAGLTPESRVLGLYCGAGAIELSLAARVADVHGVDISPENIRAAREDAAANGIANAAFTAGTVERVLRQGPPGQPPGVLVLDPPRAGLSVKAMREVLALGVPELVYVSCSPAALVRDLTAFTAAGYRLRTVAPFDFFPHTPHLETLALLSK